MTITGKIYKFVRLLIPAIAAAVTLWSCETFPDDELNIDRSHAERPSGPEYPERHNGEVRDKVLIVYSMGFNNLSYDLNEDISELLSGEIPSFNPKDNAIVILNHSTLNNRSNYKTKTSPALYQAYRMADGTVKRDTLTVFPEGTVAADKDVLNEVLSIIKERFPANSYGMIVSSHATGWAPEMYCYSPPDKSSSGMWMSKEKEFRPLEKYTAERPVTRSIGAHYNGGSSNMNEIELPDFAAAIPFHLDFIIFDCCLMGGVEVAYELKDVCDKVCFSQTEILSGGMDYRKMAEHIFNGETADLESIARDFYTKYAEKASSTDRSATVSVVDCRKLDAVAEIVGRHTEAITTLAYSNKRNDVQRYFQSSLARYHGIFYDLEDILIKSGAPESELNALDIALDECIICKFATPTFLTHLEIKHHSGLSMYLPDIERKTLNRYYPVLRWNKATNLITDNE